VAKPHQHNTDKQDATHPGGGLTPRRDWAAGFFPGLLPDAANPTDADAGQTDVPVDTARRNDRTPRGRSPRRRRQRPQRRSTTLQLALQPLPTTASTRLQCRPTVPVPVSSRGSIVSHSCCCLRRRPRCQPTYPGSRSRPAGQRNTLRSPGNSALEPQFPADSGGSTHDAKLHFASHSLADSALSISAHTVEPYLNSTSLRSTFHTAAAHCKIRAFSSTVYTHLSSLAKFLRKPAKNMCFSREHTVT